MDRRHCAGLVIGVLSVVLLWEIYSMLQDFQSPIRPTTAAKVGSKAPRIFCMIFTTPGTFHTKALAIKSTWASRCAGYALFYSKQPNAETLPDGFPLNVPEGRDHLTAKVQEALRISFKECNDRVDWFLKADDDTYVIMENLKHVLSQHDPSKGLYIGGTSSDFLPHGYNGGGAGYVLSKEAARLMVELSDHFGCALDGGFEDLEIGRCLSKFRVFPVNTKDDQNRLTFHPDHPLRLLEGNMAHFAAYTYTKGNVTFGKKEGVRVLSPETVTFHYMDPAHMYMYDFLLYELKRHHEFRTDRSMTTDTGH